MRSSHRRRQLAALLGAAALLSIASAPAEQSTSSGTCTGGYVYVSIMGNTHGPTQFQCYVPTNCTGGAANVGPANVGPPAPVGVYYWIRIVSPKDLSETTCYIAL